MATGKLKKDSRIHDFEVPSFVKDTIFLIFLGNGFKDFCLNPYLGKLIQFDSFLFLKWVGQPLPRTWGQSMNKKPDH